MKTRIIRNANDEYKVQKKGWFFWRDAFIEETTDCFGNVQSRPATFKKDEAIEKEQSLKWKEVEFI